MKAVALYVTSSLVYPSVSRRLPASIRIAPEPIVRALQRARPPSEILGLLASLPPDKQVIAYCT